MRKNKLYGLSKITEAFEEVANEIDDLMSEDVCYFEWSEKNLNAAAPIAAYIRDNFRQLNTTFDDDDFIKANVELMQMYWDKMCAPDYDEDHVAVVNRVLDEWKDKDSFVRMAISRLNDLVSPAYYENVRDVAMSSVTKKMCEFSILAGFYRDIEGLYPEKAFLDILDDSIETAEFHYEQYWKETNEANKMVDYTHVNCDKRTIAALFERYPEEMKSLTENMAQYVEKDIWQGFLKEFDLEKKLAKGKGRGSDYTI